MNVNGLLDYAGNTFRPASSTFTTGPLPDFTSAYASQDFSYGQTGFRQCILYLPIHEAHGPKQHYPFGCLRL